MKIETEPDRDIVLLERQLSEQLDVLEAAKKELDRLIRVDASTEPLLTASVSLSSELGKLRELHQVRTLKWEILKRNLAPAD
jgi:hypothetical protein